MRKAELERKAIQNSIGFAIGFWVFYDLLLFFGWPSASETMQIFLTVLLVVVLLVLFWGIRASLKWDLAWHWCGTLLFHALHGPLFVCFCLQVFCSMSFPWLATLRDAVVWFAGVAIYGGLLVLDLVAFGIRQLYRYARQKRKLPRHLPMEMEGGSAMNDRMHPVFARCCRRRKYKIQLRKKHSISRAKDEEIE